MCLILSEIVVLILSLIYYLPVTSLWAIHWLGQTRRLLTGRCLVAYFDIHDASRREKVYLVACFLLAEMTLFNILIDFGRAIIGQLTFVYRYIQFRFRLKLNCINNSKHFNLLAKNSGTNKNEKKFLYEYCKLSSVV